MKFDMGSQIAVHTTAATLALRKEVFGTPG